MNRDELIQKYGTPEEAAKAVATGREQLASGDFEAFPDGFRDLVLLEQGKAADGNQSRR